MKMRKRLKTIQKEQSRVKLERKKKKARKY